MSVTPSMQAHMRHPKLTTAHPNKFKLNTYQGPQQHNARLQTDLVIYLDS